LAPLGHLRDEDIQVPVDVDVAHLEGMRVDHGPPHEVVSQPALRLERVALALVPLHRPRAVTGRNDDLRVLSILDEPAGEDQAAGIADPGPPPLTGLIE